MIDQVLDDTVLILGVTGTTGREVAAQFIAAGHRPRLLVRSRAKTEQFSAQAVVIEGDLRNERDVARALDGIKKVYLVSAGVEGPALELATIDAAQRADVTHVVKLSVLSAEEPRCTFAHWHAHTEAHLRASGMAWTMLRPSWFSSNALQWQNDIANGTVRQATGPGKWAAVDPADIGAMAVAALTTPGHAEKAYTLTGRESTDGAGYAATLASLFGREIRFEDQDPEALHAQALSFGLPAAYADAAVDLIADMRSGEWDVVSSHIEEVLGRPANSFRSWASSNAPLLDPGANPPGP